MAEYDRVCGLAGAEYDRVCGLALATLLAVFAVECPDIRWGPNGLVFPAQETKVTHAG